MRELGYVEGQTVVFEARGADGNYARLAGLASELVRLKVDVIVTSAEPAAEAARQAGPTVPIVMAGGNPLETGLVASLARPGGNVTGLTTLSAELSAKRVELARELVPGASALAFLSRAVPVTHPILRETQTAARALGMRLHVVGVQSPAEIDKAFSTIVQKRPAAVIVIGGAMLFGERQRLAQLAVTHRLPTVHSSREYVEAGGLIAYGVSLTELYRHAAVYVGKILKGAKPGDLPIEQPKKFKLVINMRTARALGLTIPPAVLARADELIE
jgi:putative ABC transport system substrate-binding protein